MPITFAIKNSADPGNQVTFGSDGGLYVPASSPRLCPFHYGIDNSWNTDSTTWYYALPAFPQTANSSGPGAGVANFFPFMITRTARLIDMYVRVITGAAGTMTTSLYNADATTGNPTTLITDVGTGSLGAAGNVRLAPATTITLQGNTLYWFAAVQRGAVATILARQAGLGGIRSSAAPTQSVYYATQTLTGYTDSTFGSASPATASPAVPNGSVSGMSQPPFFWYGLSNA